MNNKYSSLSNEELLKELKRNLEENDLIFREIISREEKGELLYLNSKEKKAFGT